MNSFVSPGRKIGAFLFALALGVSAHAAEVVSTKIIPAKEAHQGAAADDKFAYAITNDKVGKYDRETGEKLGESNGPAHHMNAGFVLDGKLYLAHSNFPKKPEECQILVLDPATMLLTTFKDFGPTKGSLTWAVKEGDFWWCNFAYYGTSNGKTRLVKYDAQWTEQAEYTYPPEVISDLGQMSISSGVWRQGQILAIGHDKKTLYRLKLPANGTVLELVDTLKGPFPGQGIANDPKTGGLVGIGRDKGEIIFGAFKE